MNFKDVAHLKWNNISDDDIIFEREKTKLTNRQDPIPIIVRRNEYINTILKKWSKEPSEKGCVFSIINLKDSVLEADAKVHQFIKTTNFWMKKIGTDLGFNMKLTTYVARHSFATILVRGGAPLEDASGKLGHTSISTTQRYIKSIGIEEQAEYNKALIDFD